MEREIFGIWDWAYADHCTASKHCHMSSDSRYISGWIFLFHVTEINYNSDKHNY
jgi:hypothetical protein